MSADLHRILSQLTRELLPVPSLTCVTAQAAMLQALVDARASRPPPLPPTLCQAVEIAERDIRKAWSSSGDCDNPRSQYALKTALVTLANSAKGYGAGAANRQRELQTDIALRATAARDGGA